MFAAVRERNATPVVSALNPHGTATRYRVARSPGTESTPRARARSRSVLMWMTFATPRIMTTGGTATVIMLIGRPSSAMVPIRAMSARVTTRSAISVQVSRRVIMTRATAITP
jgi:hypothetical protein